MSKKVEIIDRWSVRNIDTEVVKSIRMYALQHNMSVADALKDISSIAETVLSERPEYGVLQNQYFSVSGDLKAAYKALGEKFGDKNK